MRDIYVNQELPDVQAGFRKSRGVRNQIASICWIIEKAREFHELYSPCGHKELDTTERISLLLSLDGLVVFSTFFSLSLSFFFFNFPFLELLNCIYLFIFKFYFIFKLYNIVLVLPNIKMNPPQLYMCSPS